jgi:glycosyltransferase involved in cell wall biosynthesis
VIVPAWNEDATLGAVLAEIRDKAPDWDIVVVNDCSTDTTSQVAHAAGVQVLDLPLNLGVGGAMRTGYRFACEQGYDFAVQVDADGQHDPAEISLLLAAAVQTGADIVIGARFAGKGDYVVHGPRAWAMKLLAAALSRITHTKLTDVTSGFRLVNTRALAVWARNYPAEYLGDTVEALIIASRAKLRTIQVPVQMRIRAGGVPSHGALKSAAFLLRAFLALLVGLNRPTRLLDGN